MAQLARSGWVLEALDVRMRPGKPLVLGWVPCDSDDGVTSVPFLGLPGSPVAAMVAFELFARPAVLRMCGIRDVSPMTVSAIAEQDLPNDSEHVAFLRVKVSVRDGRCYASASGLQRSNAMSSLLCADGLARVPARVNGVRLGASVSVQLIDWSGSAGRLAACAPL